MKRNKKLIKRLKARNKKNSLSKKMLGDSVFWGMQGDHPFSDMNGEHLTVSPNVGDHPFVDMKGDDHYVKPENISVNIDMNGEHPAVDKK